MTYNVLDSHSLWNIHAQGNVKCSHTGLESNVQRKACTLSVNSNMEQICHKMMKHYFLVLNSTAHTLFSLYIWCNEAASWRKRLDASLPPLGSWVRISVPPCGFRGGRNRVWVGFSRGFSRFPLLQILFHHFFTLISSISFHFIHPCDGASGVFGWHPCYSRTYTIGASSHLIPWPDLVLDTSWGYFYMVQCLLAVRVKISKKQWIAKRIL